VTQVTRPEATYMKNREAQSPTNQTLKGEIEKKNNYIKGSTFKKKGIKRIMVKIKIKNKLEGDYKFLIGGLN